LRTARLIQKFETLTSQTNLQDLHLVYGEGRYILSLTEHQFLDLLKALHKLYGPADEREMSL
jgi:hypothetical protein